MSMSPQEGRRLKAFRLSTVPIETRLRAAQRLARGPSLVDDVRPEDKLFASLLDLADRGDDAIVAAAKRPSERVYWISQRAWERVMGP